MTQTEHILQHMEKYGSITPIEALRNYGCMRLSARCLDLKKLGYSVASELVKDRQTGKHFAKYTIGRAA